MGKQYDNFTNISEDIKHLDIYVVRSTILKAIEENIDFFKGDLLDVGCGKMPYREFLFNSTSITKYIGVDIESDHSYHEGQKPDAFWDGEKLPFESNSFNTLFCTEVLEHVPNTSSFLFEMHRVLKPNGAMFFTTPFLWPLHDVPHDEFRLTPFSLQRNLEVAGFKSIDLRPLGGWHTSLAQMLGLWARRAPINGWRKRKLLSLVLRPMIHFLIKKDHVTIYNWSEGQMITGIYGIANK